MEETMDTFSEFNEVEPVSPELEIESYVRLENTRES